MMIRHAKISDAQSICDLVNHYAEQDLMLHRSLESVYESLRGFIVAVDQADGDKLLGCVAVDVFWSDSAEIRSLAVQASTKGQGLGKKLVESCIVDARDLGIPKLFAMTYEQDYFKRLGFSKVDIKELPEKIWRECLDWYNQGHRHETAMLIEIGGVE